MMNGNFANLYNYETIENVRFNKFVYCKLLPYSNDLQTESETLLAEIKANLGRAILFNESSLGYLWVRKLCNYIKIYGLHFNKHDHILLIKLLYELVTVPEIPSNLTHISLYVLLLLLKKKKLISPNELELPWRPLYNIVLRLMKNLKNESKTCRYSAFYESGIHSLTLYAKAYFPLSSTQEILDELRPRLCSLNDLTMSNSMQILRWFLPVQLPPIHHAVGHRLWLEEFMTLWEICQNATKWEDKMMVLMATVANYNIGYIDWEPYVPLMFTRFTRCLNLPVSYNKTQIYKHCEMDASSIATWIVAVLGHGSSAQMYLEKFLKTMETYFHPANSGCWLGMLRCILVKLSSHFITRLHKERYAIEKTWETSIPEEYKLTDNDVDAFVKSMLPVTMIAMFNKSSVTDATQALQHLATMRPNFVIPYVLDRVSNTLESLTTESHKLIATLNCMQAIARPLAEGSENVNTGYTYEEGPTHIIPLLNLLLPSIDPNNPEKCLLAFYLISVYACLIPIVDTSKPIAMINDEDRMDHEIASGFEDFVLQFLDKLMYFIDHSSLELVRLENSAGGEKNKLERIAETVLYHVCTVLLMQLNGTTFRNALDKLCTFIIERTLEIKVAGQLAVSLCRVFARVNGKETLRVLLPVLSRTILDITNENKDIIKEEHLDARLLHGMLLLSGIVDTAGNNLLPYIDTITEVLDHVLILKSREGNDIACKLLGTILHSLSTMIPYNFTSNTAIKYWGETLDVNTIKVEWYIPGKEEMAAINRLFLKYLIPETRKLEQYCQDSTTLTREELLISINIMSSIIQGSDSVLPIWKGEPLTGVNSCLEWVSFKPTLGTKGEILMPDGGHVKRYIEILAHKLQDAILNNTEGDTKCLLALIKVWSCLLLGGSSYFDFAGVRHKNIEIIRKMMKDMLLRKKGIIACFVLLRAEVQHVTRSYSQILTLTESHREIMLKLVALATSRYAGVRWRAYSVITRAFNCLPYSWKIVIPKLLQTLRMDPDEDHDAYEGTLNILLGQENLFVKHDWNTLRDLWTAIVLSKPTEKLSIIRLKENIVRIIFKEYLTIAIKHEILASGSEIITALWKADPRPSLPEPTEDEIVEKLKIAQEFSKNNLACYNGLINDLMNALLENNLHWRHRLMAMNFIRYQFHPEQIYPPKVIRYFLGALIHDSLGERNIALRVVIHILQQQKRKHPKISIDPPIQASSNCFSSIHDSKENLKCEIKSMLGQRPDNKWLQYNYDTRPLTAEQWDESRYIHQPYVGYYTWPKRIEMYAPSSEQPCLDPNRTMSEHEKEIVLFFNDLQNIEKLIKFYSLETKKDKDKFDYYKYILFKGIFRNHGIVFLKHFLPHLRELVKDKQESSQRCAAEIIGGIIQGSKHWPFHMVREMWDSLLPIIRLALISLTPETLMDWVCCFSAAQKNRDPNRQHWLLECLMEETCIGESESSFVECGRLFVLQVVLTRQPWRVSELLNRLQKRIEDRLLENPFENVRERLSSILVVVFNSMFRKNDPLIPQVQDFVDKIIPKLQPLIDSNAIKFSSNKETDVESNVLVSTPRVLSIDASTNFEDKERSIRLIKTICKWIVHTYCSWYSLPTELYRIFPIIYQMENYEKDEELRKSCTLALTVYAQALTLPSDMPIAIEAVVNMSKHASWWTRYSCLEFLQAWVFYNMGIFLSNSTWVRFVKDTVLRLLEDDRLEVRIHAGKVLSGLVHCAFIPEQHLLLDEFKKKAKTKLYKRERASNYADKSDMKRNLNTDALRVRHAAIIGMCAFVQAHPYDIPKYVPPVFEHLSSHMNDPQPIPTTIKKTLDDFKRTHDGWKGVKEYAQHFTEEQLAALQDLIMPPSYYA